MSLSRWFSRASSSGDASPFSGGVSRASVAERRVASLRRQTEASSAAARRVAESAVDVAAATLEELEHQTESLGRTARRLDDAGEHVQRGEEALEELGAACCPFFPNTSRRPRRARSGDASTRPPSDRAHRPEARIPRDRRDDAARLKPANRARARPSHDPREDHLAGVARALDALGDAGERMGEELDRQAAHVDDIARRAEHLRDRVDRANRRG
jgi:hypothetical protein